MSNSKKIIFMNKINKNNFHYKINKYINKCNRIEYFYTKIDFSDINCTLNFINYLQTKLRMDNSFEAFKNRKFFNHFIYLFIYYFFMCYLVCLMFNFKTLTFKINETVKKVSFAQFYS